MSRMANTSDVWWKDAVIYCVDVETFQDSDGDGIGDFAGLTTRIDYLSELGITCLWLMPFYPTPDRDDGYDVTDCSATSMPASAPMATSSSSSGRGERGIRVIVDLVEPLVR